MTRRKKVRRSKGDTGKDERLGNLPDAILGKILSLLPTKNAVGTSILSRKWRCKWVWVSQLSFDDQNVWKSPTRKAKSRKNLFVDFAERVLLLVGNLTLHKLQLRLCSGDYDPNQIAKWIQAAMRHDVKTIDVCCPSVDSIPFPCLTLWSSTALNELVIKANCCIKVLQFNNFSSLRILNLNGVTFIDISASKSRVELRVFNLSFNVLEVLNLENCGWKGDAEFIFLVIKAPKLNRISITDDKGSHSGNEMYTSECVFVMTVPKLTKFERFAYSVPFITLDGNSSVVDITVEVPFSVTELRLIQEFTGQFLESFTSAKDLKVSSKIIKIDLPELNNLIQI